MANMADVICITRNVEYAGIVTERGGYWYGMIEGIFCRFNMKKREKEKDE